MSEKDNMTIDDKLKYLHKMWELQQDSSEKEISQMLDDQRDTDENTDSLFQQ